MSANLINRIFGRLRKIDLQINTLLYTPYFNKDKPKILQSFEQKSISLPFLSNDFGMYVYGTLDDESLFNVDIETESHNMMDIKVSSSFIITTSSNIDEGSVVMKLIINNTLVTENETHLENNGYTNLSLNYIQNIEQESIYKIEVLYESCIITSSLLDDNPILNIRNNGSSLSISII